MSSIKARQTYNVEIADQPIPEPKWTSLPSFEQMLIDAFDSNINVADDKVVTRLHERRRCCPRGRRR